MCFFIFMQVAIKKHQNLCKISVYLCGKQCLRFLRGKRLLTSSHWSEHLLLLLYIKKPDGIPSGGFD